VSEFGQLRIHPARPPASTWSGGTELAEDQEWAGALIWFWVTIAYLLPAIVNTLRMLSPPAREGEVEG